MHLYRWRLLAVWFVIVASVTVLVLVWLGRVTLYHPGTGGSRSDTLVATVVQTTAAIGGITLALIFLTAQFSGGAVRESLVHELYRSGEIYILALYLIAVVLLGYAILAGVGAQLVCVVATPTTGGSCTTRVVDTLLILGTASVLLVIPTLILQIENLNPLTLADKIAGRIRPARIETYGLTVAKIDPAEPSGYYFELVKVGLRPRGIDPLRPMHEVLMEAIRVRDRVLFGKLLRRFLKPIATVHGAAWDVTGQTVPAITRVGALRRMVARRYDGVGRVHLTLAVVHYCVKRGRNFLREWQDENNSPLDIGRHGILTGLADLVSTLAPLPDSNASIRICLYGSLHVAKAYLNVRPFGRIEPMNAYFEAASLLENSGKSLEAELCTEILGWVTARGNQITADRSAGMPSLLSIRLLQNYEASIQLASADMGWMPGIRDEDPWHRN
jgi:hypothetical protein